MPKGKQNRAKVAARGVAQGKGGPGAAKFRPGQPPPTDIRTATENLSRQAHEHAREEDLALIEGIVIPASLSREELAAVYLKAEEARCLFEEQCKRMDAELGELSGEREELEIKQQKFRADQEKALGEQQRWQREVKEAENQLQEIANREASMFEREENARRGFQQQRSEVEAQIKQRYTDLDAELTAIKQAEMNSLVKLRAAHQSEVDAALDRLSAQQSQFNEDRKALDAEIAKFHRNANKLELDQKLLDEERDQLDDIVKKKIERDTTRLQDERNYYKESFEKAEKDRKALMERLVKWAEIERKIGKDSLAIQAYVERLEEERDDLREQLDASPTQQDMQRLVFLEDENQKLKDKLFTIEHDLFAERHKLSQTLQSVTEHEDLHKINATLLTSRDLYKQQLEELRQDIDARLEKDSLENSPFPQCYAFDRDTKLSMPPNSLLEKVDLAHFAQEVHMRIANPSGERPGLFYKPQDIRSFIAGLAMSRTMILQGISGVGKTSLPLAFAEAAGGEWEVIEVQAGWRDRDDLIGHYNSFEKKFYETRFTQALYKAHCPACRDRIFIILLDEMNLSYPEQYFADLLSALQMGKVEDRKVNLLQQAPANRPYPRYLTPDHRSLPVPANVWFVGTANRDETTRDIADKTYDRSHILELPVHHPQFAVQALTASPTAVSCAALQTAFDQARMDKKYQAEVKQAWDFLEALRPAFARCEVGWGNRLKGQLEVYLPVVRACGGTWGEAVDDILALKILRKIRDRYEILPQHLDKLLESIDQAWEKAAPGLPMQKTLGRTWSIIEEEERKKRGQGVEE